MSQITLFPEKKKNDVKSAPAASAPAAKKAWW